MGTSFATASLGLLIGTPLSGVLLRDSQHYTGLQVFAGSILVVAATFVLVARLSTTGARLAVRA